MQIMNQISGEIDKNIDLQSISTPLMKLGEQLTLTLVRRKRKFINIILIFTF